MLSSRERRFRGRNVVVIAVLDEGAAGGPLEGASLGFGGAIGWADDMRRWVAVEPAAEEVGAGSVMLLMIVLTLNGTYIRYYSLLPITMFSRDRAFLAVVQKDPNSHLFSRLCVPRFGYHPVSSRALVVTAPRSTTANRSHSYRGIPSPSSSGYECL